MRVGARIGFAANGVVNGLLGAIALGVAVGGGDAGQASQEGALQQLVSAPFGAGVLVAIGLGFVAYGIYAVLRARGSPGSEACGSEACGGPRRALRAAALLCCRRSCSRALPRIADSSRMGPGRCDGRP